jgi:Flp pilus assembly pilin Flp
VVDGQARRQAGIVQILYKPKGETQKMIDKLVVWALTFKMRAREERGQDVMEYALLTGLIAMAALVAVGLFTGALNGAFQRLSDWMGTNIVP